MSTYGRRENIDVVNTASFLQATRDSGYRNFESAVSELVDNSLQAGSTIVDIFTSEGPYALLDEADFVAVLDNGTGMRPRELAHALQFGGSNRFNDRSGMGRFGMGLPNSSLSQARRVDVYSWRTLRSVWHASLDLDEMLGVKQPSLVAPHPSRLPYLPGAEIGYSGTLVIWTRCDRIGTTRWPTLVRRLGMRLGQTFRYFIWSGCSLRIDGMAVSAHDPLYLSQSVRYPGIHAMPFGDTLKFDIQPKNSRLVHVPTVNVRFTELPVRGLADLSDREKRRYGIVNGAGVSIVRAGREIDYGWYFMGKRRENYDDWWRCEIQFSPELDEMFGVSHTKQGIRPSEPLRSILTTGLEATARLLNRRARARHQDLAELRMSTVSTRQASAQDIRLRPLPVPNSTSEPIVRVSDGAQGYQLVIEPIDGRAFCRTEMRDGQVTVIINPMHAFYRAIYKPVQEGDKNLRRQLELFLLALGRADLLFRSDHDGDVMDQFLHEWGRAVAVFCGGYSGGI